ncbi:hypothetical protein AT959_12875 [Dechloromonas denitrificans]|uniref:Pilus assembly protein MshD n=1 Tax=Dechloromonas denitrificans TaxID=281362 RepID=A0A133XH29_9RHOO|nr:type II secretion system protein [Dechloromonas denitrificans]KXB30247.1 hypothetical protein AT959_12875 [Dechloromonas denitrificans]
MSPTERQHGLTLVELIVFIVIVGVALTGVLAVFNETTRRSADPLIRKQAMATAESLMEELQAVHYLCPGGATCASATTANRTALHALDDYHGFTMNGIVAIDGTAIAPLAGYTATVAVINEVLNGRNGKRISITVSRGNESLTLDGWRGAY